MTALHLHLPHFRSARRLPPAAKAPVARPTAVTQLFREPGMVTLHFDTGAELEIFTGRRHGAAHYANLTLPSGRIAYLRNNLLQSDDEVESYLQLAYAKSPSDIREILDKTPCLSSWKA